MAVAEALCAHKRLVAVAAVKQILFLKATVVRLELVRWGSVVALTRWLVGELVLAVTVMVWTLVNCIRVAIDLTLVEMVPAVEVPAKRNSAGLVVMVTILGLAGEKYVVVMI